MEDERMGSLAKSNRHIECDAGTVEREKERERMFVCAHALRGNSSQMDYSSLHGKVEFVRIDAGMITR